ncbi:MAG: hypothetical protein H0V81_11655 [Solirubrobacterales bacterium]|nr:hypothetical protein [Solirubrobacterales bacterium]
MNVEALLAAAQALLDEPTEATETVWPIGAAALIRQAVEATVDDYWQARLPDMRWTTQRRKWLALPAYLGRRPELAAAEWTWSALSEACHHRDYDVGLTVEELRGHLLAAAAFRQLVSEQLAA